MKCLRIKLTQTSANYRREETSTNKMTYPLPPFSTVIGALHNACGYTQTHPMDISIQGKYESMNKKLYNSHCFLDRIEQDRNFLVKMNRKDNISKAYTIVAVAKQKNVSNYKKGIGIDVQNQELLEEYQNSENPMEDNFRILAISPMYYEILYGIELIIHVSSDENTLNDIYNNIYNLKSIGRSEDFVNVTDAEFVELYDEIDKEVESKYSAYLDIEAVRNKLIFTRDTDSQSIMGTKYLLNKLYKIKDNKREFEKKRVLYASKYFIEECSKDYKIFYDGKYIVNLI